MKANYGYLDGSGQFFITIDTDRCTTCDHHACVVACPRGLFDIIVDDYDDSVCQVKEEFRKKVKYECAVCKPVTDRPPLPCITACTPGAITHSW
jgi:Fe-S-cluster-containing hydrogenase component 2